MFREVSNTVWVSFEAVIIEKTLKEKWTNKNNFDDNYNFYYSDTIDNYQLRFAEQRSLFCIYLPQSFPNLEKEVRLTDACPHNAWYPACVLVQGFLKGIKAL